MAVIVISIGSIWRFSLELQHALTAETYRTLSEVSIDYNKAFLDSISYNIKTLKVLAGSLIELPEQQSKPEMIRILQSAVDSGGFSEVTICDANGIGCSNGGKSVNVSSRDYFQTAMRGETEISEPLFSAINGDSVIVFAVPIPRNGNITGVLLGVYPLSTAGAQLLDFTYYSEGYGFIVAPDGTILLSSEHTDKLANEKNLFSFFEKVHFIDFSLEELKTAMQQGESKSFAFTYHDERRFVSFTPSTINNWYTFSLSSDALMLQQERITREIVIELILSLSVFGSFLMIWIAIGHQRHNKELLAANQKYQSLLSHINGGMIVAHHAKTAEETLLTYVSPGFTDMTGYTLEEIQREYHGQYLELVRSEERATVFQKYLEQIENDTCY
ncbi:MAG: cache domain-containing protein, partial [Pygmaiobacter sp.]